jgi:hypothetical protein
MRRVAFAIACLAVLAGGSIAAHHSYAAYDREQLIEIDGTLESFQYMSPHSLVIVRGPDFKVYTAEWLAVNAMGRWGIEKDTLRPGERVVIKYNPLKATRETGNLKFIRRAADGWQWPPQEAPSGSKR